MDQDSTIERCEVQYVYSHIGVAHLLFQTIEFSQCHQVEQVAFRAEVAPLVVKVHSCLCTSSVYVDSLLCYFNNENNRQVDFHKPLPGVLLSQPLTCYDREKQYTTSSLLALWHEVSWSAVAFPLLRRAKTLLGPFCPYSRQEACQTVQALPDLLVLP